MTSPITGYAEGYYGRLLEWPERRQIVNTLQRLELTTYYYAPKEDPCHRLQWRMPYKQPWTEEFKLFCTYAHQRDVRVVTGVAPGLDFDFSDFPNSADFSSLVTKSQLLLDAGADLISLLMDDIDADFDERSGHFESEGQAHAALANALGDALSTPQGVTDENNRSDTCLWVTPRIYADELIADAVDYLPAFVQTLKEHHHVLYCGSDVVARVLNTESANALRVVDTKMAAPVAKHRVIFWDNLYANDYCPRRLFIGPWRHRSPLQDVLLNPTGMVHTDCLLLELMAECLRYSSDGATEPGRTNSSWESVLLRHDVPQAFKHIAPFFYHPHFNNIEVTDNPVMKNIDSQEALSALEHCLWQWKTPLSREWYGYLFGLKHDLLTRIGRHPDQRILKTQNQPLAHLLIANQKKDE
ncbi:MAG: beta-N-acetylglucosaminidase domain-containing protein [Granulosicoccus sp.]